MHIDRKILDFFANYIFKKLGIVYQDANYYQLESRLQEITRQMSFESVEALYEQAQKSIPSSLEMLILDLATNNETYFFRDPYVFDAVKNNVIPELVDSGRNYIRLWSAACSYGQEVYSLAMLFEDQKSKFPSLDYEINASDISERALNHAKDSRYSQLQIQRGLPAKLLIKWFEKDGQVRDNLEWQVKNDLKQKIDFKKKNLLDDFSEFGKFDIIFCRNILIYQDIPGKKAILNKLFDRLNEGGWLVLGAAENLIGLSDDFEGVSLEKVTFYRRKAMRQKVS